MATRGKRLAGPIQPPANVETVIYTAVEKSLVQNIVVCNLGTNDAIFNMSVLQVGQPAATGNRFCRSRAIASHKEVVISPLGIYMEVGETLSVLVGVAVTLSFMVNGLVGVQ